MNDIAVPGGGIARPALRRIQGLASAGLSRLAALGDLMLPAALAATLAARVAGLGERRAVLRLCVAPAALVLATAVVTLAFAPRIGGWLRGMM